MKNGAQNKSELSKREEPGKFLSSTFQHLTSVVFYSAILFFIIAFNFLDTPPQPFGWYKQFMPNLNGQSISDITFVDSLTGYAITKINTRADSAFVLKTTNAGNNWVVLLRLDSLELVRVEFTNASTGFIYGGASNQGNGSYLIKTTNGGLSWDSLNVSFAGAAWDMYVLNADTIWIVDQEINSNIWRSTNGGVSWTAQYSIISSPIHKIYMYNRNIGFACTDALLLKTTNSGVNWLQIGGQSNENLFYDMYFADSLTGWKNSDSMRITTNGGLNWSAQILPHGGMIDQSGMSKFHNIGRDTIWGTAGDILYPNGRAKPFLYRTTNGGINWLGQLPDTSFDMSFYFVNFTNKQNGWVYDNYKDSSGIHTVTGGNDTFFTPVRNISSTVPGQFLLFQNYPNPFNPNTKIKYEVSQKRLITMKVFDITGRLVVTLVNQVQDPGAYEADFSASALSSGVYFLSLFVDGALIDTKKMMLIK